MRSMVEGAATGMESLLHSRTPPIACHPSESWGPSRHIPVAVSWIPAFAGMTPGCSTPTVVIPAQAGIQCPAHCALDPGFPPARE